MLDSRWVVPYNPYVIHIFNCHINVEACSNIESVKYLFEYIYKGHDRPSVAIRENGKKDANGNVDEITEYMSYGPPWVHYLGGYQDRLLGGPLGLLGLCHTTPDGVGHKDYGGEVLG
jgi:hypothetical protein